MMEWQPRFAKRLSEANHMDVRRLQKLMEEHGYVVLRKWIDEDVLKDVRLALRQLEDQVG